MLGKLPHRLPLIGDGLQLRKRIDQGFGLLPRDHREVSFDEPLNTDWDGNELLLSDILGTEEDMVMKPLEEDTDRQLLSLALNRLEDREKLIITLRFGLNGVQERTQKEVADQLGISQSYISLLEKRIIKTFPSTGVRILQL